MGGSSERATGGAAALGLVQGAEVPAPDAKRNNAFVHEKRISEQKTESAACPTLGPW